MKKFLVIFLLGFVFVFSALSSSAPAQATIQRYAPVPRLQPMIDRANIIARAQMWLSPQISYDEGSYHDGYRTDCSGFVSWAWGLTNAHGNPMSLSTYTLPNISQIIAKDDLQPGDILNNQWGGWNTYGSPWAHVLIFVSWANDAHTTYNAYEENPYWGGAHYTQGIPYPFWHLKDANLDYVPRRYDGLSLPPAPTPIPTPTPVPTPVGGGGAGGCSTSSAGMVMGVCMMVFFTGRRKRKGPRTPSAR